MWTFPLSRRALLGAGLGVAAAPVLGGTVPTAAATDGPLRIGALFDTSGPASVHGKRQLLGVRHQADVINAAGGPGVRLFVRDTQGSVDVTRTEVKALLDKDKVDALIGTSMPSTAEVMIEEAQSAGVPTIVPTTIIPSAQPYVFSTAVSPRRHTRQIMRSLADAALPRAGLLILDTLATPERLAIYRQAAADHGIELIAIEPFTASETALTEPLRTLIAAAPDALIISGPPPWNGIGVREARAVGWTGRVNCSSGAGHPGFLETAGAAAEGARVAAPWLLLAERVPDRVPNSWAIRQFVAGFIPAHGPVGTFAGYGADAVGMLHHAYVGHRDRQRARDTLEHMAYVGVTGVFHMAPTNHSGLDDDAYTTLVVRDGDWSEEDGRP